MMSDSTEIDRQISVNVLIRLLFMIERFNMVNNTLYIDGQTKDPSEYMIKGDSLYTCFDNRMLNCSPIYSFSSSEFSFVDIYNTKTKFEQEIM
jgi:hypothetical protein